MSGCVVEPLERLADEVRAFVQRPELRALHVAADAHLYSGALQVLLAAEHLADNQSPWLPVDVDTHDPEAWARSDAALVREHAARRRAGAPLAPLEADVAGTSAPARCAARMRQCASSVGEPARGLVVLLLCRGATVAEPWLQRLGEILLDPALGSVRLVILTALDPVALAWSARLPPSSFVAHRCELDPAAVTAELQAEVESEERGGGTWPADVAPPPRVAPTGGAAGARVAAPAPAPRVPTPADELRTCIKRALLALRREDGPETVRQQTRARDLCRELGRKEDAVRMELVLGGYLVRLREPDRAQETFDRAAKAAAELDARALEAQARYAEASTWRERRRAEDAVRCYWAGIEAAKRGRHVQLVFDGYWEAGQVLRPLDRTSALVSLWTDAVRTAGDYTPAELRRSQLLAVARELSVELRAQRRTADARAIDEWAAQIAAPAAGKATGKGG